MRTDATPISLAGSPLGDTPHVCAFFRDDDEEYRVLLPFIRDGFATGDRAIHVFNPSQRADHLRRLAAAGIDAAESEARGQLELRSDTETYLRDGRFDQDRMLAAFEQLARGDAHHAFPRSRIVCRMDWAAGEPPRMDDVLEFESRVNDVWRRYDHAVVCTYRLQQFGGGAVLDVLRTHPLVILGGILHRNPFYVPPEQYVPELRARRAGPGTPRSTEA